MSEIHTMTTEPGVWFDPNISEGIAFDERERQQFLDAQSCRSNTPEFHAEYGGLVVAVSARTNAGIRGNPSRGLGSRPLGRIVHRASGSHLPSFQKNRSCRNNCWWSAREQFFASAATASRRVESVPHFARSPGPVCAIPVRRILAMLDRFAHANNLSRVGRCLAGNGISVFDSSVPFATAVSCGSAIASSVANRRGDFVQCSISHR